MNAAKASAIVTWNHLHLIFGPHLYTHFLKLFTYMHDVSQLSPIEDWYFHNMKSSDDSDNSFYDTFLPSSSGLRCLLQDWAWYSHPDSTALEDSAHISPNCVARGFGWFGCEGALTTDFRSLLSFTKMLEALLAVEREKCWIFPCALLKVSEVFELFEFSNDFIDIGLRRDYQIPDMRLDPSIPGVRLKCRDYELLKSISIVLPSAYKSNLRLFVSMIIHFAIKQVNSETEARSTEYSESLNVHNSPALGSKPGTAPKPSTQKWFSVILKAYTEAMVSWETTESVNENVTVKGFTDYGLSWAQNTPESLESFFTTVETKGDEMNDDKTWTQLLAYMGMYSACAIVNH